MFKELLSDFDVMSISDKRKEIKSELMYLFLLYKELCDHKNVQYRTVIDEDIKEFIDSAETEGEYLDAVYAYVEALKEMICSLLEQEE